MEKAYDRVPREELWYCMRKSGVAEKYVRVVQDMYERSRTVVRCAVGQTEEFNVEVGLHQGSALSPFLFAMVIAGGGKPGEVEVCAGEKRNETCDLVRNDGLVSDTRTVGHLGRIPGDLGHKLGDTLDKCQGPQWKTRYGPF
ncbi:hypothetical protein QTP70_018112 [Hemibagrus guttatus]|uniref:Reverse transcriptase domain-containing protein n=1 Tax=Hemibagrus guttatus TaxID=175788 RepID=A0AAE0V1P1_9TELE|nr:hypothetical protein QTP70_018112 [Hemibagrus guttatus]